MSAGTQGEIRVGPSHQVCHIYLEKSFRYLAVLHSCYLPRGLYSILERLIDTHDESEERVNRV
jgi:hypothetical protein